MPTVKLTDAAVKRLTAPKGARIDYFDAAFPGLALRVTGTADQRPERKTWTYFYRYGGKQRRLTFEPGYPALSLADARQEATQAQLKLRGGTDPADEKAKTKEDAARAPDTIANVVDLFIKRHLEAKRRAPRYIEETRRNFDNHVIPRWGDHDIKSIGRRDVTELLDAVMDEGSKVKDKDGRRRHVPGGPIAANRTLAAIRALFNFALRRGIIEATPVALVERPGEETRRERTLSADEIRAVWNAAGTLGYPFGLFFELALITGQRRDEVARMRWADLDLDAKNWTLPAEATKAGRAHVVPLTPLAIEILEAMPRKLDTSGKAPKASPWIFTTVGDAPVSGFSKAKPRLDRLIVEARGEALPPWTIHDLRRTAATEMGRLGVSRFVIGKVLNHADRTVTAIYDRYAYLQEKRHALERWSQYLDSLTGPLSPQVVPRRTPA